MDERACPTANTTSETSNSARRLESKNSLESVTLTRLSVFKQPGCGVSQPHGCLTSLKALMAAIARTIRSAAGGFAEWMPISNSLNVALPVPNSCSIQHVVTHPLPTINVKTEVMVKR